MRSLELSTVLFAVKDEFEVFSLEIAQYVVWDRGINKYTTRQRHQHPPCIQRGEPRGNGFRGMHKMRLLTDPTTTSAGLHQETSLAVDCSIDCSGGAFRNLPLSLLTLDLAHVPVRIRAASRLAETLFGWSEAEFLDLMPQQLFPPEAQGEFQQLMQYAALGQPLELTTSNLTSDGTSFPSRITAMTDDIRGKGYTVLVVVDLSTEVEGRSTAEIISSERLRVANQLHDGMVQTLAGILLRLPVWHQLIDSTSSDLHAELTRMEEDLRREIIGVRRLIRSLQPEEQEAEDYCNAMQQMLVMFRDRHKVSTQLVMTGSPKLLPKHLELTLYWITMEALNNVARHAQASEVTVSLDTSQEGIVRLRITDNGIGMEIEDADQMMSDDHFGLKHLREQVIELGGVLRLGSQFGHGTELEVAIALPLDR